MKARSGLLLLLVVVGIAALAWWRRHPADSSPSAGRSFPAPVTPAAIAPAPREIVTLPVAAQAATLNSPQTTVEDDLATLELLLSQYRRTCGGNPIGENEEIAAALLGHNPRGLAWLPATGAFLDASGRLVDRWGTPYFFHALAADRMEIHSAGPDRELHTADDLVRDAL